MVPEKTIEDQYRFTEVAVPRGCYRGVQLLYLSVSPNHETSFALNRGGGGHSKIEWTEFASFAELEVCLNHSYLIFSTWN
jgi:hypothetical protein